MAVERRNKTRVDFKTRVKLSSGTSEITAEGDLKDISLQGIFIHTKEMIPEGTPCDIRILLTGSSSELTLNMNGRIARQEGAGLGVAFDSVDIDSYYHLKNLLLYNAPDPDMMEQEIGMEDWTGNDANENGFTNKS